MTQLTNYQVFPRHVGLWEGLVRVLDADLQESKRYQIQQQFAAHAHHWTITNTYKFTDGASMTHSFDVHPVGAAKVRVSTTEPFLQHRQMEAMECGTDVINFTIVNLETGCIQEMETVTLIGEHRRCRTAQLFDPGGSFRGLLVITEQRQV